MLKEDEKGLELLRNTALNSFRLLDHPPSEKEISERMKEIKTNEKRRLLVASIQLMQYHYSFF